MGTYLDRLTADMKAAMKSGDKPKLEVVRMLISDIKKKAIDTQVDALKDEDEATILQKAVKTRQDSVAQATAAGRAEIALKEQAEIALIAAYLPQQMSATEVADKVKALAAEIGYQGGKDTGRFMKEWMVRFKGVADGKLVQDALRQLG
ncbi:MAG: GatB/YqeY domain-containing protein [Planctomycetota bacterium]